MLREGWRDKAALGVVPVNASKRLELHESPHFPNERTVGSLQHTLSPQERVGFCGESSLLQCLEQGPR